MTVKVKIHLNFIILLNFVDKFFDSNDLRIEKRIPNLELAIYVST
jgi:hypothetical protein